jgi:WD40 repeat protein
MAIAYAIYLAMAILYKEPIIFANDSCLWFLHREWISDPRFSEDGEYLAMTTTRRFGDTLYRTVLVCDTRNWRPVREIVLDQYYEVRNGPRAGLLEKRYAERAQRCGFAWVPQSRGQLLYFTPEGKLYSILIRDNHAQPEIVLRGRAAFRLSLSPNGKYAAVVARTENWEGISCVVLDISTRRVIKEHRTSMPGPPYPVSAFSHDGAYLAISDGELIDVLDLRTGKLTADGLADGDDCITALAFTPDDRVLLALDFTGELRWWDWRKGKVLGSTLIQGISHRAAIEVLCSGMDSYMVVWNSNLVTLYDLKRLKVVWSKSWSCSGCSLKPGDFVVAIGTRSDGIVFDKIMLLDMRTGEPWQRKKE